jgi:acetyltransferase-like isoleucine patch superfamily enzyme
VRWTVSDLAVGLWEKLTVRAAIVHGTRRAARFGRFGSGSLICFPPTALFGEQAIEIGNDTMIGPHCSITVGMVPGQELIGTAMLAIGDRCVIGRGSSIAAHFSVTIGDDVYFGPNVYVTDQNHGNEDPTQPVGRQTQPERKVVVGARSWLATGVVVTPGVTIGEGVSVGANSVVTTDLPDGCVAVGAPARVIST